MSTIKELQAELNEWENKWSDRCEMADPGQREDAIIGLQHEIIRALEMRVARLWEEREQARERSTQWASIQALPELEELKVERDECLKIINIRTQEIVDLKNKLQKQRCTTCGIWTHCWIQDASVSGYGEERPADVWCERWTTQEDSA